MATLTAYSQVRPACEDVLAAARRAGHVLFCFWGVTWRDLFSKVGSPFWAPRTAPLYKKGDPQRDPKLGNYLRGFDRGIGIPLKEALQELP